MALSACSASCGTITPSEQTQLVQAAKSLTDAAFTAGGPVLTTAVMALPAEAQVLIQAGYGALRKAVEIAEEAGIDHLAAHNAVQAVSQTADALHDAVHATAAGEAG